MTQIRLTSTATFSAHPEPRREPRTLATAVERLTKLQNPSRMAPAATPRSDDR